MPTYSLSIRAVFRRAVQAKRAARSSLFIGGGGTKSGSSIVAVGVIVNHRVNWPQRFRRDAGFALPQICLCCNIRACLPAYFPVSKRWSLFDLYLTDNETN
eukprot:5291942-Prymnesium_polylepis.1